ncbi:MAG: flagellin [Oscillospiraceae bacterium]
MIIQHNISALNSHRQLGLNNLSTSKNLEKLSSGFKINRAGDDAAGLAISEKMRGQIRGLAMAEQNANNGISLIQTAEGGLNETHAILQRMRELAVQSANGTYQDEVDRENLDKEVQALKNEITRIAESTHYNNIKLLDGSLVDKPGTSTEVNLTPNPADIVTAGATTDFVAAVLVDNSTQSELTFTIDTPFEEGDVLEVGGKTFVFVDETSTDELAQAKLDYDYVIYSVADAGGTATTAAEQAAAIRAAFGESTSAHLVEGLSTAGAIDGFTVTAGSDATVQILSNDAGADAPVLGDPKVRASTGTLTDVSNTPGVTEKSVVAKNATATFTIDWDTLIAGDTLKIGGLTLTVVDELDADPTVAKNQVVASNDGLIAALDRNTDTFVHNKPVIEGDSLVFEAYDSAITGEDFATSLGISVTVEDRGTETITTEGTSALIFQIGANGGADQRVSLSVGDMSAAGIGVDNVSIATQEDANASIAVIDDAINIVSGTRADLGALQNRLEHTLNNLGVSKENLTAAESSIRDVDMAKEMMEFTKNSILVQASQAMLAQANQLPQGVLSLLR